MADFNAPPQKRHPLGAGPRPAQRTGDGGGASAAPAGEAGLQNEAGEYNCFLNAVVQCLWHCAAFRDGLLRLSHAALQVHVTLTQAFMPAGL